MRLIILTLVPVLLALAPAIAQTVTREGHTIVLSVVEVPGHSYVWDLYSDATVDFAVTPGNCPITSARFTSGNKGANVSVQWLKTGIYFFKVTAYDAANCAMNLKIGMIKVIPDVEAIIEGVSLAGACQQVSLDASKSVGNIIKYEWSILDSGGTLTRLTGKNTEFILSPTFEGSLPADFRVKLEVTGLSGIVHRDTITIKVDPPPVADIYTSGKKEKDGSLLIDGTVSMGQGINYQWSTDKGRIIGNNRLPVVTVNGPGIYTLEIIDKHGCRSTKSVHFPLVQNILIANRDYGRIPWTQQIRIPVLDNDYDSENDLNPSTVKILENPKRGGVIINKDGSVIYGTSLSKPGSDQFIYEVCDSIGDCVSAEVLIDIFDAGITVPEAFSPNGDGENEFLIFKGLENYPLSQLYVYTRAGQLVHQSENYLNDWIGIRIDNGQILPTGTYYYVLKLGGTNRVIKGFVFINY